MRFLFPLRSLLGGHDTLVHALDEDEEEVIIPDALAWKPEDDEDDQDQEQQEKDDGQSMPIDDATIQEDAPSEEAVEEEDPLNECPPTPAQPWRAAALSEEAIPVDVVRSREHLHVYANVAGVRSSDIQIELNNDLLTIKAFPGAPWEDRDDIEAFYALECSSIPRARSLILPLPVDPYSIRATVRSGILDLRFVIVGETSPIIVEELEEDGEEADE